MTQTEIILMALVKYGPNLAKAIYDIFNKPRPTAEDWNAIFALAKQPYESYTK